MAESAFTPQRIALLSRMLGDPDCSWYALQLAQDAGVRSSTVYDALNRWRKLGWIEFAWEEIDPAVEGRPRRKLYRFTTDGAATARVALDTYLRSVSDAASGAFGHPRTHIPGWGRLLES